MLRRIRTKPTILTPAGKFFRRLRESDDRLRKRLIKIGLAVIAVLFVWSCFDGEYGILRIAKLSVERNAIVKANQRELAQLIDATRIRDLLKYDRSYIEFVARTRYHMAAPNETIYRFRGR
jgi:cell division protein FtsB